MTARPHHSGPLQLVPSTALHDTYEYRSDTYGRCRIARVADVVLWHASIANERGSIRLAYALSDVQTAKVRFAQWRRRPPDA